MRAPPGIAPAEEVRVGGELPRIEVRVPGSRLAAGIGLRPLDFGRSTETPTREVESAHRTLRDWAAGRFHTLVGGAQVHGARLFRVDGLAVPGDPDPPRPRSLRVEGYDGFLATEPGVLLTVGVADCVPALLHDPGSGALALVHAGWRGVAAGIVPRAIAALAEAGAGPETLVAWWGPAIGPCCYPVGEEVVEAIRSTAAGADEGAWVARDAGGPRVDLRAALSLQARAAGVRPEAIVSSPLCTVDEPDLLHSYRRESGGGGRMLAWAGVPRP